MPVGAASAMDSTRSPAIRIYARLRIAPVRTSISLPARTAWVTAGVVGAWAGEREAATRTANSGKLGRIMLGLKIASASLLDKNSKSAPQGSDYNERTSKGSAMVAWWKRLIYSLVSAILGAGVGGAWVAAQQLA